MGSTNSTVNYSLSQFIATDKPAWLQDYNGDMLKIDTAIKSAKTTADTAQTTANTASSAAETNASAITALQTTVSGLNNSVTNMQGTVNTIQSLIGNGTPTTTDHTIIGAINEINAYKHLRKIGRVDLSLASTAKADWDTIWTFLHSQINSNTAGKILFSNGNMWDFQGPASDNNFRATEVTTNDLGLLDASCAYCANGTSKAVYTRVSSTPSITDYSSNASTNTYADIYIWE